MNGDLKLFLHKYVYPQLSESLMVNITNKLDVFSIEQNTFGFKARVKKGNIKRGEDTLECYHECLSAAFCNFFHGNSTFIIREHISHNREVPDANLSYLSTSANMSLFYDIILLPDNYIQINI